MSLQEKVHFFACPAARRALRRNDQSVMWCIGGLLNVLDDKCEFTKTKQPNPFKERITLHHDSDFIITTFRSKLLSDELVMIVSQYHGLWGKDLEWFLAKCKPLALT